MMSYERSNNRGQIVGTVLGSARPTEMCAASSPTTRRRRAAIARIDAV